MEHSHGQLFSDESLLSVLPLAEEILQVCVCNVLDEAFHMFFALDVCPWPTRNFQQGPARFSEDFPEVLPGCRNEETYQKNELNRNLV